jgi:hypothetical protein
MCLADIALSLALLPTTAQPPPLANIAVAEDGGSIDDVLANIQVAQLWLPMMMVVVVVVVVMIVIFTAT